jgi:hypothetical protein
VSPKLIVQRGHQNTEWPKEVGEAFIRFCLFANEHGFDVICAVGFNFEHVGGAGDVPLSTMLSPRASRNPHQAEMLGDIAELFKASSERSKQ